MWIWLGGAILVSVLAILKGRKNGSLWLIYGLIALPIAFFHVLIIRYDRDGALELSGKISCPTCAEAIMAEARVCRFCGADLTEDGCGVGAGNFPIIGLEADRWRHRQ